MDRADFGDRHLEVGEEFQEVGLERLVGAVEFVDQQYRRAGDIRLQRLQQRPLDQKPVGKNRALDLAAVLLGRLGEADLDHLAGIVPFVDRRGDVEPFVALQPNQPALQSGRQHLGDLGLADPGLAFEKQRPAQMQRQMHRRREAAVGDVIGAAEQRQRVVDRGREGGHPETIPINKIPLPTGEGERLMRPGGSAGSALDTRNLVRRPHSHHPRRALLIGRQDRTKFSPNLGNAMRTINIHAAKTQLSRLVDAAAAGEEIIIAKSGKPIARLGPLAGPRRKRRLGVLAGRLRVPEDFDADLPDEVLDAFEGR